MTESPILAFYRGTGTDHRGRTLDEIRRLDFDRLESTHDYIQWLFPLPEGSGVLPQAPRLSKADIEAFVADPSLVAELRASLLVMLDFYGLEMDSTSAVVRASHFEDRAPTWLFPMNHNHLRLTRIMRSLSLLGLKGEARALQRCLLDIAEAEPRLVHPATVEFWRGAVESPPQAGTA